MGVGVGAGVGAGGVGAGAGAGDGVVGASDEDDSQPMATSETTRHPVTAKRRIMRTATSSRREKKRVEYSAGTGEGQLESRRNTRRSKPSRSIGRRVEKHLGRVPPG